jgi:hypothetical protein
MTVVGLCRESSKALSFRGWEDFMSAILDSVTMPGEVAALFDTVLHKNPGATAWFAVRRDKQLNCQTSFVRPKQDRLLTLKGFKVMDGMAKLTIHLFESRDVAGN